jgi:replicative DNA helicase
MNDSEALMDGDIEQAAIGSMLQHGTADTARAEFQLVPEMYHYPAHRTIVNAIYEQSDAGN